MNKPGANWEEWYRALKAHDMDVYRKAITYAEAVSLNFNIQTKAAAEIERSHVMFACELLGVTLPPNPVERALATAK